MKKNKKFNRIMKDTMLKLNLKPHVCGMNKVTVKNLCSAADIEGHLGTDKKVFVSFIRFYSFFFISLLFFSFFGGGANNNSSPFLLSLLLSFTHKTKFSSISLTSVEQCHRRHQTHDL